MSRDTIQRKQNVEVEIKDKSKTDSRERWDNLNEILKPSTPKSLFIRERVR